MDDVFVGPDGCLGYTLPGMVQSDSSDDEEEEHTCSSSARGNGNGNGSVDDSNYDGESCLSNADSSSSYTTTNTTTTNTNDNNNDNNDNNNDNNGTSTSAITVATRMPLQLMMRAMAGYVPDSLLLAAPVITTTLPNEPKMNEPNTPPRSRLGGEEPIRARNNLPPIGYERAMRRAMLSAQNPPDPNAPKGPIFRVPPITELEIQSAASVTFALNRELQQINNNGEEEQPQTAESAPDMAHIDVNLGASAFVDSIWRYSPRDEHGQTHTREDSLNNWNLWFNTRSISGVNPFMQEMYRSIRNEISVEEALFNCHKLRIDAQQNPHLLTHGLSHELFARGTSTRQVPTMASATATATSTATGTDTHVRGGNNSRDRERVRDRRRPFDLHDLASYSLRARDLMALERERLHRSASASSIQNTDTEVPTSLYQASVECTTTRTGHTPIVSVSPNVQATPIANERRNISEMSDVFLTCSEDTPEQTTEEDVLEYSGGQQYIAFGDVTLELLQHYGLYQPAASAQEESTPAPIILTRSTKESGHWSLPRQDSNVAPTDEAAPTYKPNYVHNPNTKMFYPSNSASSLEYGARHCAEFVPRRTESEQPMTSRMAASTAQVFEPTTTRTVTSVPSANTTYGVEARNIVQSSAANAETMPRGRSSGELPVYDEQCVPTNDAANENVATASACGGVGTGGAAAAGASGGLSPLSYYCWQPGALFNNLFMHEYQRQLTLHQQFMLVQHIQQILPTVQLQEQFMQQLLQYQIQLQQQIHQLLQLKFQQQQYQQCHQQHAAQQQQFQQRQQSQQEQHQQQQRQQSNIYNNKQHFSTQQQQQLLEEQHQAEEQLQHDNPNMPAPQMALDQEDISYNNNNNNNNNNSSSNTAPDTGLRHSSPNSAYAYLNASASSSNYNLQVRNQSNNNNNNNTENNIWPIAAATSATATLTSPTATTTMANSNTCIAKPMPTGNTYQQQTFQQLLQQVHHQQQQQVQQQQFAAAINAYENVLYTQLLRYQAIAHMAVTALQQQRQQQHQQQYQLSQQQQQQYQNVAHQQQPPHQFGQPTASQLQLQQAQYQSAASNAAMFDARQQHYMMRQHQQQQQQQQHQHQQYHQQYQPQHHQQHFGMNACGCGNSGTNATNPNVQRMRTSTRCFGPSNSTFPRGYSMPLPPQSLPTATPSTAPPQPPQTPTTSPAAAYSVPPRLHRGFVNSMNESLGSMLQRNELEAMRETVNYEYSNNTGNNNNTITTNHDDDAGHSSDYANEFINCYNPNDVGSSSNNFVQNANGGNSNTNNNNNNNNTSNNNENNDNNDDSQRSVN